MHRKRKKGSKLQACFCFRFPPIPFPQPNGCWRRFLTPTGLFPSSSETLPGDQVHCKSLVPLWNVGDGFGSEGRERSTLWGDNRLSSHSKWGEMSGKAREKSRRKPVKLALCLMFVLKTSPRGSFGVPAPAFCPVTSHSPAEKKHVAGCSLLLHPLAGCPRARWRSPSRSQAPHKW